MEKTALKSPWLPFTKVNTNSALRLICFPYAGGSASIFHKWQQHMSPKIEVCPVQYPGRGTRMFESSYSEFLPLVHDLVRDLVPYLQQPFVFFGHSMGALVSFEVVRVLRNNYQVYPQHLFVSGHSAPQIPDPNPPVHNLPEPEFLEEIRKMNGTPKEALENEELMQLLLPTLRADFAACETYEYKMDDPIDCPLTVFGGLQDPDVSLEDLKAWRQQTKSSFNIYMFEGDHFFLHQQKTHMLEMISARLNDILQRKGL
jgi:medium-chain acyl-[acyl-carrier-protein] hydrolase